MNFVEFITGSITNRNKVVSTTDCKLPQDRRECYRSLFRFDEDFKRYVEEKHSTAGYSGKHDAEAVAFDFDGQDLEAVRAEVVTFIAAAESNFDIPADWWRIAFSGNKGFHCALPMQVLGSVEPSADFFRRYGDFCKEIAAGFKLADTSIYTLNRIFRMSNSVNAKSGLYKIPLTLNELRSLSIDSVKELAHGARFIDTLPMDEYEPVAALVELWKRCGAVSPAKGADRGGIFEPAANGSRNNHAIKLTGWAIEKHLSKEEGLAFIRIWNKTNGEPLADHELKNIVEGAYKRYSKPEAGAVRIKTLADGEQEYILQVDTPEAEKVRFGIASLDKKIRTFIGGMVASIVAKSSNGKSSFIQSVLLGHAKRSGKPVLFFSLEMPVGLIWERTLQYSFGSSGHEIENGYRYNRATVLKATKDLQGELKNFFIVDQSGITIETMKNCTREIERWTGQKVSLVAIDYLSLVGGPGKDIFERTTVNALRIKQIAKDLNCPIVFLSQTTKSNSVYDELDENSGKDAGAIFEASDFQIVIYREEGNEMDEGIDFTLKITKNRMGHSGAKIPVRMNKLTMRWEEDTAHAAGNPTTNNPKERAYVN